MSNEEIDPKVLESLAAKVDGLNLSAEETAVLDSVLARAADADAEVQGFGMPSGPTTAMKTTGDINIRNSAVGWGLALGVRIDVQPGHYIGETEKNIDPR